MEWDARFATGIPMLDEHHKGILRYLNDFERALERESSWNEIHYLMVQGAKFLKFHHAVEETLMEVIGYPGLEAHRLAHQQMRELIENAEETTLRNTSPAELIREVQGWFVDHLTIDDKSYSEFARNACGHTAALLTH